MALYSLNLLSYQVYASRESFDEVAKLHIYLYAYINLIKLNVPTSYAPTFLSTLEMQTSVYGRKCLFSVSLLFVYKSNIIVSK